tara:strand:+ start:734 stop:1573 length:840 start_codon:yes stop_codon:yes gene_type:complete
MDATAELVTTLKDAMSPEGLQRLMNASGPVCKTVVIAEDGTVAEESVDMTPSKEGPKKVLGGETTFVGQFMDLDVVILVKTFEEDEEAQRNLHSLPSPFSRKRIHGKILLVRMDENAEPKDFTKAEYEEYKKKKEADPEHGKGDVSGMSEDEGSEDEEGELGEDFDDEEDDENDLSYASDLDSEAELEEAVAFHVMDQYESTHGKQPTDEEMEAILANMKESGAFQKIADRIKCLMEEANRSLGNVGEEHVDEDEDEDDEDDDSQQDDNPAPSKKRKTG